MTVYRRELAYGGPEEGGWWYDTYTFLGRMVKVFRKEDQAIAYARRWNDRLHCINRHLRPYHSVLSTGHYEARVEEDRLPEYLPDSRPYYE